MIDWSRVLELRNEVGVDDFEEVVDLFLEEVEGVIADLDPNASASQLEQHLHFLKGSALSLGFADFSSMCQEGERLSAGGETEAIDLPRIVSGFEASKQVFQSELDARLRR